MWLSEENQAAIKERFAEMQNPVVLQFVGSSLDCPQCSDVEQLLDEVCNLSPLLTLEKLNRYVDEEAVKSLKVDKVPAISITDESRTDYGIRFYGTPGGYEFSTLLADILMMSSGESGLSQSTRDSLKGLQKPMDLSVFVTPTCPYCPAAVHLAHQFAFESPLITGNMVEATEFPDWANQFDVYGVPKTVMNQSGSLSIEGAVPEQTLLERVLAAV